MNRSIKEITMVFLLVALIAGGGLSGAASVRAQEKGSTFAQQLQGSWLLDSIYNEQDGKKIEPFGAPARGFMVLTPDGHFSMIFMKPSLPKFAANNRMKGTAAENQAIVQGSHAFFGTYKVASEKEHTVNLHIDGSTFPNMDGQDQQRVMIVQGDELRVTNSTTTIGGVAHVVWKRAKK